MSERANPTAIDKLKELQKFLNTRIYGRDKLIKSIILSLMNSENVLIIGSHGEAKSMILNLVAEHTNLKAYYKQIHQQTTMQDILGVINPLEFQKGKLELLKTDFWNANIMHFDEFLRNSELVDFLMEVMVEHTCSKSILGKVKLDDLISVIATSNPITEEYHTEKMDLALLDRFGYIVSCKHLLEDNTEQFKKVIRNLNENYSENGFSMEFDVKELKDIKETIRNVKIPDELYTHLDSFAMQCLELKVDLSTRLMLKLKKAIQTLTVYNGREAPTLEEFKESIDLIFANRISKEIYSKIAEKIFNTEEYELNEEITKLNSRMSNGKLFAEDMFEFLTFYNRVSEKYLFFSEETKAKLEDLFKKINGVLKTDYHSRDFGQKMKIAQKFVKYSDLEELKEFLDSMDLKVETKFLPKEKLDAVKKLAESNSLDVSEEKFERQIKLIIAVKELTSKQIKDFVKITEELTSKDLISRF